MEYVSLIGAKCFHKSDCSCLAKATEERKKYFCWEKALETGLRWCTRCIDAETVKAETVKAESLRIEEDNRKIAELKRELESLVEFYHSAMPKVGLNIVYVRNNMVSFCLGNKKYKAVSIQSAVNTVSCMLRKIERNKGKGYMDNKMSVNAKLAHNKGLKPKSYFTREVLDSLGFKYPLSFFLWLIDHHYINFAERHHTSAGKRMTKFYNQKDIAKLDHSYDLQLLYEIHSGIITKTEARKMRGIEFVRIQIPQYLLTFDGKVNLINMDCIRCDGLLFYSEKLCFNANDTRIVIKEKFDIGLEISENKNLKKLSELLIARKTNTFRKYIRT